MWICNSDKDKLRLLLLFLQPRLFQRSTLTHAAPGDYTNSQQNANKANCWKFPMSHSSLTDDSSLRFYNLTTCCLYLYQFLINLPISCSVFFFKFRSGIKKFRSGMKINWRQRSNLYKILFVEKAGYTDAVS